MPGEDTPAAETLPDPWNDRRPIADRITARQTRFEQINEGLLRLVEEERTLARAAVHRFAAGELSLGEIYTEFMRWEQHAAVLATYPEGDGRRDGGIAYAEGRMSDLARQGNRILSANKGRLSKRDRVFAEPDFVAARFADLVGLAETLGYEPVKRGRHWWLSCPWHGTDSTPSLEIYEPGLGWYCHGCGRGGQDAASFAAEHFSCSQAEGLRFVGEMCDVPAV